MAVKKYITKVGRKIGNGAQKVGRDLNQAWKSGRKVLRDIENTPVLGEAVRQFERSTGADQIINAGDAISSAFDGDVSKSFQQGLNALDGSATTNQQ